MRQRLVPVLAGSSRRRGSPRQDLQAESAEPRDIRSRVCADPDNMPLSNQKGEGFEQKIAELIAKEWNTKLEYAWWPVRRGYFSRALNGRYCDVAIEAPAGLDMAGVTKPYFRSGLRLPHPQGQRSRHQVARRSPAQEAEDRSQPAQLRRREHPARDGAEPVRRGRQPDGLQHVLHRRGPPRGHRRRRSRTRTWMSAIVWGPVAGYFAKRSKVPLQMMPLRGAGLAQRHPFPLQHRDGACGAATRSCGTAWRRCSSEGRRRSRRF